MKDLAELVRHYTARVDTFGDGPLAVDWNAEEAQALLFHALFDGLGEIPAGARLLDVGCGLGALITHLRARGIAVDYTGYDVTPAMVMGAQRLHPEARFEVRNILDDPPAKGSFDYVVMSGALNLCLPDHARYVRKMIHRMYALARRGVACNLLSAVAQTDHVIQRHTVGYYPEPADIVRFARRLTPLFNLRHDVATWTFTLQLLRPGTLVPPTLLALAREARTPSERLRVVEAYLKVGLANPCLALLDALPPSVDTYALRAVCAYQLGQPMFEQLYADVALALGPTDVRALSIAGHLAFRRGLLKEARDLYARALALLPSDESVREDLFSVEMRLGARDAAEVVRQGSADPIRQSLWHGELCLAAGHFADAARAFAEVAALAPAVTQAHWRLAQIAARTSNDDRVATRRACYERILSYTPNERVARVRLARLLLQSGEPATCVTLLEDEVFDAELDLLRAQALQALGRGEDAELAASDALRDAPELLPAHLALVRARLLRGDRTGAAAALVLARRQASAGDFADALLALAAEIG